MTFFIQYAVVANILRLHLITFFTIQNYLEERMTLFNTARRVDPNILALNNFQSTKILLYGNKNL